VAPAWTPTPTPTHAPITAVTGPTLAWSPVTSPPTGGGAVVAPGDGTTAYACAPGDDSHTSALPQVWRTRDTGASWQRQADVPSHEQANECQMLVDPSDALHVVAALYYLPNGAGGGPDIRTFQNFVSSDGGATWTVLPAQPQVSQISQFASYQGTTYAVRSVLDTEQTAVATDLYASADGMQTWQSLTASLTGQTDYVKGFWLNQATGTLLVQTAYQDQSQTLWRSDDGGQHWTSLTSAPSAAIVAYMAQARGNGQAWRVCGWSVASSYPPAGGASFACSADGGLHWSNEPALASDDQGAPFTSTGALTTLADDGTVLALGSIDANGGPPQLYLLPPGATHWQECGQSPNVGAIPVSPNTYASSPGAGVLWGDVDGRLYVARYPT
jgi:hypothetical protein